MEDLTKTQMVLLVLLVSFVTSLATVVITVTLLEAAPRPIANNITHIVRRIADSVTGSEAAPGESLLGGISQGESDEDLIIRTVAKASPAVVSIVATKDLPVIEQYYGSPQSGDFFGQFFAPFLAPQYRQNGTEKREIGAGSGFIVSKDGLVVTNRHVVDDADANYTVVLSDGSKHDAEVLARDPVHDIAILRVKGRDSFAFIPLATSDMVQIGQTVIAIGNALGEFQNTVSVGVISGVQRSIVAGGGSTRPEQLTGVLQTDAAINPGNSGGPLLNKQGQAIGINTAVAGGAQNIGFALPIALVRKDVAQVEAHGKISYPYLGVQYVMVTKEVRQDKGLSVDYGALIVSGGSGNPGVVRGSPAAKAGLEEGDIILRIGGEKVTEESPLADIIQKHTIGEKLSILVLRDSKEFNADVVLGER